MLLYLLALLPESHMTITTYAAPDLSFQTEFPQSIPGIFLAGPILGAGDWQADADTIIREIAADMNVEHLAIFNPRQAAFKDLRDFTDDTFYAQVDWEHAHLKSAKTRGVRLFWICNKTVELNRNYALTTLFELGEAIGYAHDITGDKIVVGIESGFTNEKYLRYTIAKKAPNVILTSSLEETCFEAIQHISNKYSSK